MPDLGTIEGQQQIESFITEDTALIIIDNLSCLVRSGRENEAEGWIVVQTWALNLRALGISVLFIHHSGKGGSQRGTSKKEDVLDTVISLERPKDYDPSEGARFVVRYDKARGFCDDDAKPFEAQLCRNTDNQGSCWKTQSLEESNYEKSIALLLEGLSQKEVAE